MARKKIAKEATPDEVTRAENPTLELVAKDFSLSWQYCAGALHDRWARNYKLYHNERVNRGYEGITDTFVPMAFGTVEALVAALFGGKPKFSFLPPQDKPDQNTDILNSLLDYYWERDQWSVKDIDTGREMLTLGTSIDYFYWHNDHPVKVHVPLRDFFIDPTATSLKSARYMGRRYLTTREELESYEVVDYDNPIQSPGEPTVDPETGEMIPGEPTEEYVMKKKYQLPEDDDTEGGSGSLPGDQKTDKQEKDDLYGSTLPAGSGDQVEVLEYWTERRTISVLNRSHVIEDSKNYYVAEAERRGDEYPVGLIPFAAARRYVDPSLFYAKGEIDFIAQEQELLNDITNQNIDSITYTLNQMYTLDPNFADKIEEVENLPGAVYPFPKDALMPIPQRSIPPDAFNERLNIKNEIREATAVNEVIKGVGEEHGSNTTATEINAQLAGAGQRIALTITQLENEYYHDVAAIVFCMTKLYVTEPMMVRILGKDGAHWESFDPSDFAGTYEPRAQLDVSIQKDKVQEAAQAKELLAAFSGDPAINQVELKRLVLTRAFELDPDEVDLLIQPMPPMIDPRTGRPAQPVAPGGTISQGQPQPQVPEERPNPTLNSGPEQYTAAPDEVAALLGMS